MLVLNLPLIMLNPLVWSFEVVKFNSITFLIVIFLILDFWGLRQSAQETFLKMEREKEHFESTISEKRKKDKDFGKMIKNYKKSNYKKS